MSAPLISFPPAVATVAPCELVGCPLDRHATCDRNGCPGERWKDIGGRDGLYDVSGEGEVVRADAWPCGEISTEDMETAWWPHSAHRAAAIRWYADEMGFKFSDVRCTVEWLRCVDRYEDGRKVAEWADDMWWSCKPDDLGAHKFWRLEIS